MTADGQNLIIQTKNPLPGMPGYLADPLFIIVDTTAEPARDFSKDGSICTGPYMVENFVKERAAKLLDEADRKDSDGDGIREKDGRKLELDFVVYNSRAKLPLYAEAVQSALKKLGFDIKINTDGSNSQNGSGYSNPAYDAKLAKLSMEFDKNKRRQLIVDLQQILLDDGASLFFVYPQTNIINAKYVDGVVMYPSDSRCKFFCADENFSARTKIFQRGAKVFLRGAKVFQRGRKFF